MHPKLKGLLWIGCAVAMAALAVVGFSLLVRKIPPSVEHRLGEELARFPQGKVCHEPSGMIALGRMMKRLSAGDGRDAPMVQVEVLRGGPLNAFATVGPRIYVYEELLTRSYTAEEVAGVLAHELGHVTGHHVLDRLGLRVMVGLLAMAVLPGQSGTFELFDAMAQLKFSREQEYDADIEGLKRMQKARIDTGALGRFFSRLPGTGPGFLSDHPASESRARLAELYPVREPEPVLTAEEWRELREICR